MIRRLIGTMSFWSSKRRYLLLQWIVIVLNTVTVKFSTAVINGEVKIDKPVVAPNEWVKLECIFNLTNQQLTLLYWGDKNGDALYYYEIGEEVKVGPVYENLTRNITIKEGRHSLEVFIPDGCNKSPYKCDIWQGVEEKYVQADLKIKLLTKPEIYQNGSLVGDVQAVNGTHKFLCKIPEVTEEHNLTMKAVVNGAAEASPAPRDSSFNSSNCLYKSSIKMDYEFYENDEVEVKCTVQYKNGVIYETIVKTPDPCRSNPCQEGGTCVKESRTTFRCDCPDDYTGPTCAENNTDCFIEVNKELSVILGQSVTLECEDHKDDVSYTWRFAESNMLIAGFTSKSFTIDETFASNQSTYVCYAKRQGCSREKKTRTKLTVEYSWEVTNPVSSENVNVNNSLTLNCTPTGQPTPRLVQWFYLNDETDNHNEAIALGNPSTGNAVWTKSQVALSDAGIYSCRVFFLDVVKEVETVTVTVSDPSTGSSTMLLSTQIVIIIAVAAALLIIVLVIVITVVCVKKKKGWYMHSEKRGDGTLATIDDFQYSRESTLEIKHKPSIDGFDDIVIGDNEEPKYENAHVKPQPQSEHPHTALDKPIPPRKPPRAIYNQNQY